jgi:hypothetical protein
MKSGRVGWNNVLYFIVNIRTFNLFLGDFI